MFSSRCFCRAGLPIVLLVVAFAGTSWGQDSSTVEQQFADYNERLSAAAASLLATPDQPLTNAQDHSAATAPTPANANENFDKALKRVRQLHPLLDPILREEGVPLDMAAIVLVESGGRPNALSRKGALGLWQLMPGTARRYGLTVSSSQDDRVDIVKATRAAAHYLRDLYTQFGDWRLAFAAYNAGEQTVQRAMMRSGSSDFGRLTTLLPSETRAYVPAVAAARLLFAGGHVYAASVQAARTAQVLYANVQLDN